MSTANNRWARVLLAVGSCWCVGLGILTQTAESQSAVPNDFRREDVNPTHIVESPRQNGDRTLDKRSVQVPGFTGHLEFYQDIETETLQVDVNSVRITTRTFARDGNGTRTLVELTEEEKQRVPGGGSKMVRLTSRPDLNGRLQPVRREIVETRSVGLNSEETNSAVMLPSINGGLAPAIKTLEFGKRTGNDSVETEKTTWLQDGNGDWQVSEVRQASTTRQEGTNRTTEERVSRLNAEGRLGEVSRVVSKESESTSGEHGSVIETYAIDVPGTVRDGNMHLVERTIVAQRVGISGERTTEQQVEQHNPGSADPGLRVSIVVDGRMVPGPSGEQSTVTIRARDLNGNFGIVAVDATKSDRVPTIQVQQTPAGRP